MSAGAVEDIDTMTSFCLLIVCRADGHGSQREVRKFNARRHAEMPS
jgi:hypothetical protein